jgi:hypothetical protein
VGLPHRGYKGKSNIKCLAQVVDALLAAAPWLKLDPFEDLCRRSDDALDAVIAALTARAAPAVEGAGDHQGRRRWKSVANRHRLGN